MAHQLWMVNGVHGLSLLPVAELVELVFNIEQENVTIQGISLCLLYSTSFLQTQKLSETHNFLDNRETLYWAIELLYKTYIELIKLADFVNSKAFHRCLIMHKCLNKAVDFDFNFKYVVDVHKYNIRNKQNLYLQRTNRNWGQQTFTYHGTQEWNALIQI